MSDLDPAARAVRITQGPSRGMLTLRGDLASEVLQAAVRTATGCAVPPPRRIEFAGDHAVAWMAPDELLLFLPDGAAAAAGQRLDADLAGITCLVADVSDARAVFRLIGPGSREVLAKGAPVDLAPAVFGPGDFRRTRLGQVAAAFWMPVPDVFELVCFRSVSDFVAQWLHTCAAPGSLPGFLVR